VISTWMRCACGAELQLLFRVRRCTSEGEECWFSRRSVCDGIQLGIMLAKRFGDFDFCAFQDADELKGVDDGLALEVIVGDDESVAGMLGHFADAGDPGSELFGSVEIVVAFMRGDRGVIGEPGVVAAAVKANVACRGSGLGRRSEGVSDNGLIDVAKTGVVIVEKSQSFRRVPGSVANFYDEGIVGKAFQHGGEISDGLFCAMERERELEENGAKFVGRAQNIEAGANGALIGGGRGRSIGGKLMSEALPKFSGEDEAGVCDHAIEPLRGVIGTQWLVEGSVDFDGVEEFGKVGSFVEIFWAAGWIDVTTPIGIGPAGGTDADD